MEPVHFLWLLIAYTAVASMVQFLSDSGRAREFRELARQWRMQYVPDDRLRVAERISGCLPMPGAAGVCVMDLMYGTEADRRRYLFTVEYGQGTVHAQKRLRLVMAFEEGVGMGDQPVKLEISPDTGSVFEQYRVLAKTERPSDGKTE